MFPEDKHLDEISDFPKKRHNLLFRLHAILPTLRKRLRSMSYRHIAVPRGNPLLPLRRKTLVDGEMVPDANGLNYQEQAPPKW